MGGSISKKSVSDYEDPTKFPYVLNLHLTHYRRSSEDKDVGTYDYSSFYISGLGKHYRERYLYDINLNVHFLFQFPLTQKQFDSLTDKIEMEGYFYKEDKEEEYCFSGKFIVDEINKKELSCTRRSQEIVLNLEKDSNKSFENKSKKITFDVKHKIVGTFLLDYLKLENVDNLKNFNYYFYGADDFEPRCLGKSYYMVQALRIISENLKEILKEKNAEKKQKYVNSDLIELLGLLMSYARINDKEKSLLEDFDVSLLFEDYYVESFLEPNKNNLYRLWEKHTNELMENHLRGIIVNLSLGVFDYSYQIKQIFEWTENRDELKEKFFYLFDLEFIKKVLTYQIGKKLYDGKMPYECHIFFYIFLKKELRKIIFDNESKLRPLIEEDEVLRVFKDAIFYSLKIEFENADLINDILLGKLENISITDQHMLLNRIIELNSIKNKLYMYPLKEEDIVRESINRLEFKTKIFEFLNDLSNKDQSYIDEFLNPNFAELMDFILNEKGKNVKYFLESEEISNLSEDEVNILLNEKFSSNFIKNNFKIIFEYLNGYMNRENFLKFVEDKFESLLKFFIFRKIDIECEELFKESLQNNEKLKISLVNIVNKDYIENVFTDILINNEKANFDEILFICNFPEICNLLKDYKEYFDGKFGENENYKKLFELHLLNAYNLVHVPLKVNNVFRVSESTDLNALLKRETTWIRIDRNIPAVFRHLDEKEFYPTHIWLRQPYWCTYSVKNALFLSGTGNLPEEHELRRFYNYEFDPKFNDFGRFNYLAYIEFDKIYSNEEERLRIVKTQNLAKSEYMIVIFIDKYGDRDQFEIGGCGCFGTYSEEDSKNVMNGSYSYLSELIK
jgi:hypothetical protein